MKVALALVGGFLLGTYVWKPESREPIMQGLAVLNNYQQQRLASLSEEA